MIGLGILAFIGGYGISSWGYCLVKGYDITLAEWFDPVHVYEWPATVPVVPKGRVWPSGSSGSSAAAAATAAASTGFGVPE